MTRALCALVMGLAVAAAGCGPAAVLESGGPVEAVAMLPAEVGVAADASEAYQFEPSLGYSSTELEYLSLPGPVDADVSMVNLGFAWYFMGAVQNDDTAIGLQALEQKASSLSVGLGFGTYDPAVGSELDVMDWNLAVEFVLTEGPAEGLGFELDYEKTSVEDGGGPGNDYDISVLRFGALYHIPVGSAIIPKLGYSSWKEDDGSFDTDIKGIDIGVEYYTEIGGQWIDAELTIGFLTEEPSVGSDEDVSRLGLRFDYYPLKELMVGINWKRDDWDITSTYEVTTLGVRAVYSCDQWVPGLDFSIAWTKESYDVGGTDYDNTTFGFDVDYRF